jgi:hypothetical protein
MPRGLSRVSMPLLCILVGASAGLTATEAQAKKGFRAGLPRVVVVPRNTSGKPDSDSSNGFTDSGAARSVSAEDQAAAVERAQKVLAAEKVQVPKTAPVASDTSINNVVCIAGCMRKP